MITVYFLVYLMNNQVISEFADKTTCEIYKQYWEEDTTSHHLNVACIPARRARTGRGHEREKP